MPAINIEIGKLSVDQKRQLVRTVTKAASEASGVPEQAFYVFVNEHPHENVAVGGELLADRQTR